MSTVRPLKHHWPLRYAASNRQANDMLGVDGLAIVARVKVRTS